MCARSFFRLFRNGCAAAHLCRGAAVPEGRRAPLFFAGTLLFPALIAGRFFMPETKKSIPKFSKNLTAQNHGVIM